MFATLMFITCKIVEGVQLSEYKMQIVIWSAIINVVCNNRNIVSLEERDMFYLMTHSTHFIYGYMVKDHSDSEKGNPLPPHRLLLSINSKGSFICTIPQTG